ncbi:hypothetical protein Rsub_12185 [Raphidocelis subcapitata]|uniref:Uncharacterized protein n=1 Tax=Raphidocelis subcapitata TaxID=307507 RepID=A0A2V0PHU6_9CHLO|nr:hypothetical protein Rsub_12185 [Raphidocelis subcapitata]|eukprot:GBF99381.1 hypothetical protein Rsub_12185 [Raphidocelis subcapitata]
MAGGSEPSKSLSHSASRLEARRSLLLVKPRKRTPAERLGPSLHLSISAAAAMAVVAAAFISASAAAEQPIQGHLHTGCTLAAATIALIAMPELGHSNLTGPLETDEPSAVMIGGWLFCGLYLAYQAWWYLALLLGAFTFASVASSHWVVGKEAMYPPMVVAAFVVCVGFATPKEAVVGTLVKTCGIASGILIYTVFSTVLFPVTATQQVLDTLELAINEMRDLADVLMRGRRSNGSSSDALPSGLGGAKDAEGAASNGPAGRVGHGSGGRPLAAASQLAATVPAHLREAASLLPATAKERYLGRMPDGFMCFIPMPVRQSTAFGADVLAVLHVAHIVHRALWLMITTDDADASAEEARGTGSLLDAREFAAALPTSRAPRATAISTVHVERYTAQCEKLYRKSLKLHTPSGSPAGSMGGAADAASATARARWRRAIERTRDINAARRGGAAALSRLVGGMLDRGDVEATRWCATLLLLQQLGLGLWRLQDCLSILLRHLPGGDNLPAPKPVPTGDDIV